MFEGFKKIKDHFDENKKLYFGMLIGSAVTIIVIRRGMFIQNTVAPVFNNMPQFNNNNSSAVNFGGAMEKIVMRMSDKQIVGNVTEAAKTAGKSIPTMSKHLNKYPGFEFLDDEQYVIWGIRTAG